LSVFYGPVLSKRFGRSLGIDIIDFKCCEYDCIYCQLGRTTDKRVGRKHFEKIKIEDFKRGLEDKIKRGPKPDFITFSGSGEPLLEKDIARYIKAAKSVSDIPVAVLTGGGLLGLDDALQDIMEADLIKVSVDGPNEELLQKINRPCSQISFKKNIEGLGRLAASFGGRIWVEIMMIGGINDDMGTINAFKSLFDGLNASIEKIHLNTPTRPSAGSFFKPTGSQKLKVLKDLLGDRAEIVKDLKSDDPAEGPKAGLEDVIEMLKRRPCTLEELSAALDMNINEVIKLISFMLSKSMISCSGTDKDKYYYLRKKETV
jgi:wyosine [tRNA(Phe)-imidazoG37] synthetase (radical SAM superfamily)